MTAEEIAAAHAPGAAGLVRLGEYAHLSAGKGGDLAW